MGRNKRDSGVHNTSGSAAIHYVLRRDDTCRKSVPATVRVSGQSEFSGRAGWRCGGSRTFRLLPLCLSSGLEEIHCVFFDIVAERVLI